jgi:hypothetical protein
MNQDFKRYFVLIAAITSGIFLAGWAVFQWIIPKYYLSVMPYMLLFFALVSLLVFRFQLSVLTKDMGKFTRSTMILTIIRLFLYSAFALIYIVVKPQDALAFVVSLFVLYLVFNITEITEISRLARNKRI